MKYALSRMSVVDNRQLSERMHSSSSPSSFAIAMQKYSLLLLLEFAYRLSHVLACYLMWSDSANRMSNNIVVFLQHRNSAALSVCVVFLYSLSQSLYFVFFFVLYLAVVALIFYESLLHNLINLHLVSFNYFSSSLSLSLFSSSQIVQRWTRESPRF